MTKDELIEAIIATIYSAELYDPFSMAEAIVEGLSDKGATHILMQDGTAVPLDGGEAVERPTNAKASEALMQTALEEFILECAEANAKPTSVVKQGERAGFRSLDVSWRLASMLSDGTIGLNGDRRLCIPLNTPSEESTEVEQ